MDWLKLNKIDFAFHNYKEAGISVQKLNEWCDKAGWEKILNKRSTTWRELPAAKQKAVTDQPSAVQVMQQNNSIIKHLLMFNRINSLPSIIGSKFSRIVAKRPFAPFRTQLVASAV